MYSTGIAFFRTCGDEWVSFETKSADRSAANDGDTICDKPFMARDISGTEGE